MDKREGGVSRFSVEKFLSHSNHHLEISSGGNRKNHPNLCDSMIFLIKW